MIRRGVTILLLFIAIGSTLLVSTGGKAAVPDRYVKIWDGTLRQGESLIVGNDYEINLESIQFREATFVLRTYYGGYYYGGYGGYGSYTGTGYGAGYGSAGATYPGYYGGELDRVMIREDDDESLEDRDEDINFRIEVKSINTFQQTANINLYIERVTLRDLSDEKIPEGQSLRDELDQGSIEEVTIRVVSVDLSNNRVTLRWEVTNSEEDSGTVELSSARPETQVSVGDTRDALRIAMDFPGGIGEDNGQKWARVRVSIAPYLEGDVKKSFGGMGGGYGYLVTLGTFTLKQGEKVTVTGTMGEKYEVELMSLAVGSAWVRITQISPFSSTKSMQLYPSYGFGGVQYLTSYDNKVRVSLQSVTTNQATLMIEGPMGFKAEKGAAEQEKLPEIQVTKEVDKTQVKKGEQIRVTVTVRNIGDGTAKNVKVRDTVPSGLSLISGSVSLGPTTISSNQQKTISYVLKANQPGTITLPSVQADYEDEAGNKYTSDPTQPITIEVKETKPRLTVSMSVEPTKVKKGETVRVTVNVQNSGDAPAKNLVISGNLPVGALGTPEDKTVPELLPQASTTHTYDFKVTKTGTITIPPAKVTYYDEEGRLYEESSSGATVTVVGTPALEVTHSVNPPEAKVGEEVEVSITITNTGDGTADNVRVTFTPPMELEPKEGQPTTVTLGRITPGQKKMPKFYLIANESGEITIPGDSIVIEYSDEMGETRTATSAASQTLKVSKPISPVALAMILVIVLLIAAVLIAGRGKRPKVAEERPPAPPPEEAPRIPATRRAPAPPLRTGPRPGGLPSRTRPRGLPQRKK